MILWTGNSGPDVVWRTGSGVDDHATVLVRMPNTLFLSALLPRVRRKRNKAR